MQALSWGRCYLIRYYVVAQPVPEPFVPMCKPSDSDRISVIDIHNPLLGQFPRPITVLQARLEKGYVCLAATNKQIFSGFLWYAQGTYEEDEVHCSFVLADPEKTVWDFDVYVEPRFRLGRTFARLWDAANETFSLKGVKWSISRISAFNQHSLHSHGRMGIHRLHTLTFFCLGAIQISLMSCKPYFNISWNSVGRPVVLVDASCLEGKSAT